jgi:tetratricopeptide (TPR) repeat protein
MLILKQLLILFLTPILGFVGILGLSANYWSANSTTPEFIDSSIINDTIPSIDPSSLCLELENQIINSQIDNKLIEENINRLDSNFEKDYLTALLNKREENYKKAFDLLSNHINVNTSHLNYYDELVNAAKITNNLDLIQQHLIQKTEPLPLSLYLSAIINFETGKYQESILEFKEVISSGFTSEIIYYKLAHSYRLIGEYEKSLKWLNDAESILDSTDRILAKVLNARGSIYFLSGEYEIAEEFYTKAHKSSVKTGNVVEEIKSLGNLAIIKDLYGDVYSAREYLTNAIEEAKKIQNFELLAFLFSELGVSFTYTAEIITARDNYEKSYEYYSTLKNRERLSYLSSNIGSIYLQQANYKSALKYYEEGLDHSGENKLGTILNLTGIADVYSNSSNYSKALEYYNKAKQLADSINAVSSKVRIDQGIGALFYNINRPYRALNFLLDTEGRIDVSELPFEATEIYYKIGTVLASIDSINQSEVYLKKGLDIAKQTGDVYYEIILNTELANTLFLQENYPSAIKHLKYALTISKEYELIQLMSVQELYYGKIFQVQNYFSEANVHLTKSFELASQALDFNTQIEAGFQLAKINLNMNNEADAERWFKRTIELIEQISIPLVQNQEIQIAHFSAVNEIYNSLTEFYLDNDRITEAFDILERSRSRNTMQNLENLRLLSVIKDEQLLNRYLDLTWMVNSDLYSVDQRSSLVTELEELRGSFIQKYPELKQQVFDSPWKDLDEIQNILRENDNLISIYVSENELSLFHLTKDNLSITTKSIGKEELRRLLEEIAPIYKSDLAKNEIYINQDLFSFNAKASWYLYTVVFKELIDKIPSEERLIFSFSNELLLLPAELLVIEWDEDDSPYYYEDKKFLIHKYPILYTPSASIYTNQYEKSSSFNESNLLVGSPEIANEDFAISYRSGLLSESGYSLRNIELFPLEYSSEEIENVDGIIANNVVLLSDKATEENFKSSASTSNIIHLSTHSFLIKSQPLIIFSQTNDGPDDGYLEVSEIIQMNLNSDLVVLSSCRSGLGRVDEAEGLIGMQKAFFEAGANSIVVSLWDVNDKYTSLFMKDFYNHLSRNLDKATALRKAKLDFIKKHSPNPYYWSAFILSGNPTMINLHKASSFNLLYLLLILLAVSLLIFFFRKSRLR